MKYISTRNSTRDYSLSQAMFIGLAPDGGLFVPKKFPDFNYIDFSSDLNYQQLSCNILFPFFSGDPLENKLESLCCDAFNFNVPLRRLDASTYILELFHGLTLSFKDFGARFLAACLNERVGKRTIVMVATSGDTGSAVASAFYKKPNIDVVVLFPRGQISSRQEQQITCWGENIHAFAVEGCFDDCQRLVKSAFRDLKWRKKNRLCTANSINIGRLLPQVCYYAFASLKVFCKQERFANFIVPSGNLGNVTAACWAKKMGFPINKIVIATNANCVISEYLKTGNYQPRASILTLANAMDVGDPSNFERLLNLFPNYDSFRKELSSYSVSDEHIKRTIKEVFEQQGMVVCPHTATGCWVRKYGQEERKGVWVIVATAHPCKFETIIEPIIQEEIPVEPALSKMISKENHFIEIKPSLDLLAKYIEKWR